MEHPPEASLTNTELGLSSVQAACAARNVPGRRLSDFELVLSVLRNQVASFFFFLLVISGALSIFLHQMVDAWIFFAIAGINAVIGFFQEFRASRSALMLEQLIAHVVTVRRDGVLVTIPSHEVALGDIVLGGPGDVIVADMLVRESTDLFLDESVLTGETLPRQVGRGDRVVSGASVVSGALVGQVVAVGKESSILMYADKVSRVRKDNGFDRFIGRVSNYILLLTVLCLVLVLVVNVLVAHSMSLPDYVLYGISMLVGVVPESLPLIVTLILTREALKLADENIIVKKLSVLQNLGSMNYLFTDKTGTITENSLRVKEVLREGDGSGIMESLRAIALGEYERTPMDRVFDTAISGFLGSQDTASSYSTDRGARLLFSPFEVARGYAVYTFADGSEILRGQYAIVARECGGSVVPESPFIRKCLSSEGEGLRIIALAKRRSGHGDAVLQGAVIFEDPLKEDAVETYRDMRRLGIDVKIITGDSLQVAAYVGGVLDPSIGKNSVFSMDGWVSDERSDAIERYLVYARCKPEQKSALIDEHLGHGVVGFLGEGINDALALKRADIGFVVSNASDIARQSGDVILLEKSLNPIVTAITMSRRAFVHIRTYLLCTLTGNIGTLISLTAVVVLWQQIPMLPIQILLNNLLTDMPLMFLITDRISGGSVQQPVRDGARRFFWIIFLFASLSSVFDFIFFFAFKGYDISVLRTGWFVFSVFAELTLVFSLRSELSIWDAPRVSILLGGVVFACYAIAIALPYTSLGGFFQLVPLTGVQVGGIVGIILVYLGANEAVKYLFARR